MKKVNRCRWLYAMVIVMSVAGGFGGVLPGLPVRAEESAAVDAVVVSLRDTSARMLDAHQFGEFLKFLEEQRLSHGQTHRWLLSYYEIMTKSLYLDYLEQQEQWKEFYGQLPVLNAEVMRDAAVFVTAQPDSELSVYVQFFAWKAQSRVESDEEEQAFSALLSVLVRQTVEQGNTALFKTISDTIRTQAGIDRFNQVYQEYTRALEKLGEPSAAVEQLRELAQRYQLAGQWDTARSIYRIAVEVAERVYDQAAYQDFMLSLIRMFVYRPFAEYYDVEFAESLFAQLISRSSEELLDESLTFLRALNLEMLEEFAPAVGQYDEFVRRFPRSAFAPEALTRAGLISGFYLRESDRAETYWKRVEAEYGESVLRGYCLYHAGLFAQIDGRQNEALELYRHLIAVAAEPWPQAARERVAEIEEQKPLPQSIAHPLALHREQQPDNPLIVTLTVNPAHSFAGATVNWQAMAQDFSAGTVQPYFATEWYGALGEEPQADNELLRTRYRSMGPQLVWFSAQAEDTVSIVGRAAWSLVFELTVPEQILSGQPARVSAVIPLPVVLLEDLAWRWALTGPEQMTSDQEVFDYSFTAAGTYTLTATLSIRDTVIAQQTTQLTVD